MPRALKIHFRNACRSDFYRAFLGGPAFVTESVERVTCLLCKREISKHDLRDVPNLLYERIAK